MNQPINLIFNFVEEANPGAGSITNTAQTGDLLFFIIVSLAVIAAVLGIMLCLHYNPFWNVKKLFSFANSSTSQTNNLNNTKVKQVKAWTLIITGIIALLLILCAGFIKNALAADAEQPLVLDTNNITATVHNDGSITFSTCNLKNVSIDHFQLDTVNVKITDEAKSVSAINNSQLSINGFGGCIYNEVPDGKDHKATCAEVLDPGNSTTFSFLLTGLDKQSALDLCGKSVFSVSLTPALAYKITYDEGVIPSSRFIGDWPADVFCAYGNNITADPATSFGFVGYSVEYWEDKDGNKYVPGSIIANVKGDIILTANWKINSHKVIFDSNGHGESPAPIENVIFGKNIKKPSFSPTVTGYIFNQEWCLEEGCGSVWDFDKDTMPDCDLVLYAKWTPITYTVHFDSGILENAQMQDQVFTYDEEQNLLPNEFARTGYDWACWTWGEKKFADKEAVKNLTSKNNDKITFIASWTAHHYIVKFNPNFIGDTDSETGESIDNEIMADLECVYDEECQLPQNTYRRGEGKNFEFGGWATSPRGHKVYEDKSTVKNLTAEDNAIVTLYAVWDYADHTIDVKCSGGGTAYCATSAKRGDIVSIDVTPDYNYRLKSITLDGKAIEGDSFKMPGKDINIYVQFVIREDAEWSITVLTNGFGTANASARSAKAGTNVNLQYEALQGFKFDRWDVYPPGEIIINKDNTFEMKELDIKITAIFEAEEYNVQFNTQDKGDRPIAQKLTYGQKIKKPSDPSCVGFIFEGWCQEEQCINPWDFDKDVVKGNMTLYAKWSVDTYKVTFDKNGHGKEKTPDTQEIEPGKTATDPSLTDDAYVFLGWYTDKECKVFFDFNEPITNDTNLYAGWTEYAADSDYISLKYDDNHYYHPVFPDYKPPIGVIFYKQDNGDDPISHVKTIADVAEAKSYSVYIDEDVSFTAVRSIENVSFNDLYPESTPVAGQHEFDYKSQWAKNNLVYENKGEADEKCLETVERLDKPDDIYLSPEISTIGGKVSLADIYKKLWINGAENPIFGTSPAYFWSNMVPENSTSTPYNFECDNRSTTGFFGWSTSCYRDHTDYMCACISRTFNKPQLSEHKFSIARDKDAPGSDLMPFSSVLITFPYSYKGKLAFVYTSFAYRDEQHVHIQLNAASNEIGDAVFTFNVHKVSFLGFKIKGSKDFLKLNTRYTIKDKNITIVAYAKKKNAENIMGNDNSTTYQYNFDNNLNNSFTNNCSIQYKECNENKKYLYEPFYDKRLIKSYIQN